MQISVSAAHLQHRLLSEIHYSCVNFKKKNNGKEHRTQGKAFNKKEQRVVSGGYAPTDSPIKPIDDNNGMPDFKTPSKEDFKFY